MSQRHSRTWKRKLITLQFVITLKTVTLKAEDVAIDENGYESDGTKFYYTRKEICPSLSIAGMEMDADYILSYEDNIEAGIAKVTATFIGNYCGTYTCSFTIVKKAEDGKPEDDKPVTPKPVKVSSVKITGNSKYIAAGKKIQLTASVYPLNAAIKKVKWYSSNKNVASVTPYSGIVTMTKKGAGKTVTITAVATDGSGKKAVYKIKSMKGYVKKVKISGKKTLTAGKSTTLKANVTATAGAYKKVAWASSNTKYAKVSSSGKVITAKTAKGKTVKITAMALDGTGKKATYTIKIK